MIRRLGAWLDLRPGEGRLTTLLFLQYFLLLTAYYFLKPARDALFLIGAGAELLPAAFVVSALLAAPVAGLYARAGRRLSVQTLTVVTLLVLAFQLPVLYLLLREPAAWVFYLLYAWVGMFGILTTSQFWLLAGELFDASQARRIFPALGVAGILGAFFGGELTRRAVVDWGFGTEELLLAGLATTLASATVALLARSPGGPPTNEPAHRARPSSGDGGGWRNLKLLGRSRLLTLIVALTGLSVLVTAVVDYQFKAVSAAAYPDARALASFLGSVYGLTSLLSLLLQLVLAGRLLRWLGVAGALAVLPAVLTLGAAGLLVAPTVLAATLLRGGDLVLKHSVQRTAREMLFLPVPAELKRRTKVVIDIFVDRLGRGAAGLLLLGLTLGLHVPLRWISVLTVVLLLGWLLLLTALRREYVDAFRQALARRQIEPGELRRGSVTGSAAAAVIAALDGGNDRQIAYALELLPNLRETDTEPRVRALLDHPIAGVRRRALVALNDIDASGALVAARDFLSDENLEVRVTAVDRIAEADDDLPATLRRLFAAGPSARNAALIWLSRRGDPALLGGFAASEFTGLLEESGAHAVEGRRALAYALRDASRPECRAFLERLANDSEATVARAAIRSLGAGRDMRRLPWLLEKLESRPLRRAAREALVDYGRDGLLALRDAVCDPGRSLVARTQSARALGGVRDPEALDALLEALPGARGGLRREILRQAVLLRASGVKLRGDRWRVIDALDDEAARWFSLYQSRRLLRRHAEGDSGALLRRVVDERLRDGLENCFSLLGLLHDPRGLLDACAGVLGDDRRRRGHAVAYLEQLLEPDLRERILPLIDDRDADAVWAAGHARYGTAIRNHGAALAYLAASHDDWLRACLVHHVRVERPEGAAELLSRAALDPAPVVREAAHVAGGFR